MPARTSFVLLALCLHKCAAIAPFYSDRSPVNDAGLLFARDPDGWSITTPINTRSTKEEDLAVHYAETGQLEAYYSLTAKDAYSPKGRSRIARDINSPCLTQVGNQKPVFHALSTPVETANCWEAHYPGGIYAAPAESRIELGIIRNAHQGNMKAAWAGLKLLKSRSKKQAEVEAEKETKRSAEPKKHNSTPKEHTSDPKKHTSTTTDLVPSDQVPSDQVSSGGDVGTSALTLFGWHVTFNWILDPVAQFFKDIGVIFATVVVAITVCAEPLLEPPGSLLMAGVVWSLCGGLVAEVPLSVMDLAADLQRGEACINCSLE